MSYPRKLSLEKAKELLEEARAATCSEAEHEARAKHAKGRSGRYYKRCQTLRHGEMKRLEDKYGVSRYTIRAVMQGIGYAAVLHAPRPKSLDAKKP